MQLRLEERPAKAIRHSEPASLNGAMLPRIPVLDVGPDFPLETLRRERVRAHALLDAATRYMPRTALKSLDAISRRWLEKWENDHLPEIEAIAAELDRPGAFFLSVNYEWGCTCSVQGCPDEKTARLIRVLDWRTPGLGRNILAARVGGKAGPFTTMTWPGYTGVLQAMAPGRFAAALNQAPMRKDVGLYLFDWAAGRVRVWQQPHMTPAHVLRSVFETARSYVEAKRLLTESPVAAPCIFSLAGLHADELCVIERTEVTAHVHEGRCTAANHWQAPGWDGRARGHDSAGRARVMQRVEARLDGHFPYMETPIRNSRTRLVMEADATQGRIVAQGYEAEGPATAVLKLAA